MTKRKTHPSEAKAQHKRPSFRGWKTTDEEEIERRRLRASTAPMSIEPLEPRHRFYGTFAVRSENSSETYVVEIRSLTDLENSCECMDYQINGLGTCKHIEAVLAHLQKGPKRLFEQAASEGSPRAEIYLSRTGLPHVRIAWPEKTTKGVQRILSPFFSADNTLLAQPTRSIPALRQKWAGAHKNVRENIRIAREVEVWVADLRQHEKHAQAKQQFLQDMGDGKRSMDFLRLPLYPYQKEGVLHLAFGERTLLADDMGLGKTVQAVGACELLRQIRNIERVLVVSPVSLKSEWEEQISKFTDLSARVIWGPRAVRLRMYRAPSFFYLANYEQIRNDLEEINRILAPDVVILDEAQRIKNWQTKTAKAVKRLSSPYAFVLTGTPLENRIDELYSIVEFLDPQIFGPLFRFNREYYELDDKGRAVEYKNLGAMRRRIRPIMLRRRKEEVEDQLPQRTVNNYFVTMESEQRLRYDEYRDRVARLLAITKRRSLTREEFERLQKWLACMRMICDTPFILDEECRICPKLPELASILEDMVSSNGNKVLVFSEWERMLHLVRDLAEEMSLGFAWHTGSVPQQKRRQEIRRFKNDPDCVLFLSTDSGSLGLNLQEASAVVNLDLPWNPAKLEQRIARAWRKHQRKPVNIVNFVCEDSIEHRMLGLLAQKRQLADGVLDGLGDLRAIKMPSGRAAFLERLAVLMGTDTTRMPVKRIRAESAPDEARDPYESLRDAMVAHMADRLLSLESNQKATGQKTILAVVDTRPDEARPVAKKLLQESFTGSRDLPALELVDRKTYETIERLVEAGFLQANEAFIRHFHRNPAFNKNLGSPEEKQLGLAKEIISGVHRKIEMSTVLSGGGFAVEAVAPIGEAVELAVKASALMAGEVQLSKEKELPLAPIQSRIVSAGLLPDDAVATVASVREAVVKPQSLSEDDSRALITSAHRLIKHVEQAIGRKLSQ